MRSLAEREQEKEGGVRLLRFSVLVFCLLALAALIIPDQIKMRALTSRYTTYRTYRDPETGRVPPLELILKREMGENWDKYPKPLIIEAFKRANPREKDLLLGENQYLLIPNPRPE